jgi:hypothetical protein
MMLEFGLGRQWQCSRHIFIVPWPWVDVDVDDGDGLLAMLAGAGAMKHGLATVRQKG